MRYSPVSFIRYHLYLLQLENYELGRFLSLIRNTKGIPKKETRGKTVRTAKMSAVAGVAFVLQLTASAAIAHALIPSPAWAFAAAALLAAAALSYIFFAFAGAASALLAPLDFLIKKRIIARAKEKLRAHKNLTVIGIAGSYGKTTMKELVAAVLREKYRVACTPGNINTPLGISRFIENNLPPETEVFVVEMGEHYPGDIRELCRLAPPSIGVVTGINESHLARFGTVEKAVACVFELAEEVPAGGSVFLNADDPRVRAYHGRFTANRNVVWYGTGEHQDARYRAHEAAFNEETLVTSFTLYEEAADRGRIAIPLLGSYSTGTAIAAVAIGRELGLSFEAIRAGIAKTVPVPHRLEPIRAPHDVLVIDDSYNGNPQGAEEAIRALGRFGKRRKIYVTPGLVEMGSGSPSIHRRIGALLAPVADVVVLIRNQATPFIQEGLREEGFPEENIRWFASAREAHEAMRDIVRAHDAVLFQNDWPDNY